MYDFYALNLKFEKMEISCLKLTYENCLSVTIWFINQPINQKVNYYLCSSFPYLTILNEIYSFYWLMITFSNIFYSNSVISFSFLSYRRQLWAIYGFINWINFVYCFMKIFFYNTKTLYVFLLDFIFSRIMIDDGGVNYCIRIMMVNV